MMTAHFVEFLYYGALASGFFLLAMIAILDDFPFRRPVVVGIFLTLLATIFLTSVDLMSRPKPTYLILPFQKPDVEEAVVMGEFYREGEYIMLLLYWEGLDYPRYFRFPWSQELAEQLQEGHRQAGEQGDDSGDLMIENPFDPSLDRRTDTFVHPMPQIDHMPPKDVEAPPEVRRIVPSFPTPGDQM